VFHHNVVSICRKEGERRKKKSLMGSWGDKRKEKRICLSEEFVSWDNFLITLLTKNIIHGGDGA
jgi:hypothetical protein